MLLQLHVTRWSLTDPPPGTFPDSVAMAGPGDVWTVDHMVVAEGVPSGRR